MSSSESNEWYTPAKYILSVRRVLGTIDLDPASNLLANQTVKSARYFGADNGIDGLFEPWRGKVFCNPPYGRRELDGKLQSNQKLWSQKMIGAYTGSYIAEGILLINSNTEASYFRQLWKYWKCFTDHRIKFVAPPSVAKKNQPTKGNVFVYFGKRPLAFAFEFSQWGQIVPALDRYGEAWNE